MVTVKEDWTKGNWPRKEGWLKQEGLTYVGLIGIGVVIMQPFIAAASLDLPSRISVLAFSIAIPLLAALVIVNQVQSYLNSSGIGLLVTLLIRTRRQRQHLLVFGLSEHYRHIFEITRLNDALGIFDTEAQALAAAHSI